MISKENKKQEWKWTTFLVEKKDNYNRMEEKRWQWMVQPLSKSIDSLVSTIGTLG